MTTIDHRHFIPAAAGLMLGLLLAQPPAAAESYYRDGAYYNSPRVDNDVDDRSVENRGNHTVSAFNWDKKQEANLTRKGESLTRQIMAEEYKNVLPQGYSSIGLANLSPEAKAVLDKRKAELEEKRAAAKATADSTYQDPVSQEALDALRKMSDYLGGLNAFCLSLMEYREVVRDTPVPVQVRASQSYLVQRPNRLRVTSAGGGMDSEIWFDGENFTVNQLVTKKYISLPMPGSIDSLIQELRAKRDFVVPAADLLYHDLFASLSGTITKAQHRGTAMMDGKKCDHLVFASGNVRWQLWIQSEGTPIPLRINVDYPGKNSVRRYAAKITDLRPAEFKESDFAFRVASGTVASDLKDVGAAYQAGE